MYRDDLAATHARLDQLQRELADAQSAKLEDKQRIALLTAQLAAAQQALQRLGAGTPHHAGYPMPGRGNTILVLGVLSVVLCQVVGPIAWAMGNEEMRRIDSGLVDPSTRNAAFAGRICGMVSTILMIATLFFAIAFVCFVGTIAN